MFRRISHFLHASDGSILPMVAISLAAIFGLIALSFDVGRIASTQSQLQSFADSVALAAAGELDGQSDAITRATARAEDLIEGHQSFASGGHQLLGAGSFSLTFLSGLPNDDTAPVDPFKTTDPAAARYVRVSVPGADPAKRTVNMTFGAVLGALIGSPVADANISAEAVAGNTSYACDIMPMMFCLPSADYNAYDHVGDMIVLRSGGGTAAWGPGNFGFLDPAKYYDPNGVCSTQNGAKRDACILAAQGAVTQCFAERGVDTLTGQRVGIEDSVFNVRFDIYGTLLKSKKNDIAYAPAPNVIKGAAAISKPTPLPQTIALPDDTCLASGTCGGGRFGDGEWDRAGYVTTNFGTDPMTGNPAYPPGTGSESTRYGMYLAEIAKADGVIAPAEFSGRYPVFSGDAYDAYRAALINADSNKPILTNRAETGRETVSGAGHSSDPERRVLIVAGVDCNAPAVASALKGKAPNVPVKEFVKVFLTRPVRQDGATPPDFDINVEVLGSASVGDNGNTGIVHNIVQLYR